MTAIALLRKQINKDRAYIRGVHKETAAPETIEMVFMRKCDIVFMKKTLKQIYKIRPVYYWLKPEERT
jgi:hypothetical protein